MDVEIKECIITRLTIRGRGETGSPKRKIIQVWDRGGNLIAEADPYAQGNSKESELCGK